jgi:hypothetical protein
MTAGDLFTAAGFWAAMLAIHRAKKEKPRRRGFVFVIVVVIVRV